MSSRTAAVAALVLLVLALPGARPAWALPIFSSASLSVDAISPNGDGVQEYTQIRYTIAVDSADVRILVTGAGGSPVADTLQVLTRQAGFRTRAFDGGAKSGPLPDGDYEIRILGIGSSGEGDEQVVLPLRIDRSAPVISSLELVAPAEPVVRNGTRITVQACVDGDPETVTVDFSLLDTGWDPGRVTETPVSPACRRFSYTVTTGNSRGDSGDLPVRVVAVDRAGNRSERTLLLCLSNHPPVITSARLLNEFPVFQNGDLIQAEVEVMTQQAVRMDADFSNLDSGFNEGLLTVTRVTEGQYVLEYYISGSNARPDGTYRLPIVATDAGGCGSDVDSSLTVTLDNQGALPALVTGARVTPTAFSPNGDGVQDNVTLSYTVLEDTVSVIISVVYRRAGSDNPQLASLLNANQAKGGHTLVWDGRLPSGQPAPDQTMEISIRAISVIKDRQRTLTVPFVYDLTPPVYKSYTPPEDPARNGERVDFTVTYDGEDYAISPDFSQLDSNWSPGHPFGISDQGGGVYDISYPVSESNTRPDGNHKDIRLTATDPAGNTNATPVSGLVLLCLSNEPPRLVSTELLGNRGPFKNGEQIDLLARFVGGLGDLQVGANFSSLDDKFDPGKVVVVQRSDAGADTSAYEIAYRISNTNGYEARSVRIPITVADDPQEGCGSTLGYTDLIGIDNERPAAPTIDPVAGVVRSPLLILSGHTADAADTYRVQILFGETVVDTFAVGATGSWSGQVALAEGQNRILAKTIDAAGNISLASKPAEVFYVQSDFIQVPGRFAPGDEFFLGLLRPASAVTVHIFNLEGVEIARVAAESGDLFRITWDGKDNTGSLASSGPYLAAVEVHDREGRVEWLRKAFVFTRRGAAQ